MDGWQRPAQPSEYALEQPDSPGRWWFTGIMRSRPSPTEENIAPFFLDVDEPQPFTVLQRHDNLIVATDDWELLPDIEWVGWWVKLENN